jgi:predicted negative regulator of RcsB-dependent stress response
MALTDGEKIVLGLLVIAVVAWIAWYYYLSPEGKAYQAVNKAANACQVYRANQLPTDLQILITALADANIAIVSAASASGSSASKNSDGSLTFDRTKISERLGRIVDTYNAIPCISIPMQQV